MITKKEDGKFTIEVKLGSLEELLAHQRSLINLIQAASESSANDTTFSTDIFYACQLLHETLFDEQQLAIIGNSLGQSTLKKAV